jgi:hypothetical protein
MRGRRSCPRCGAPVQAPGPWTASWTCPQHGAVAPRQPVGQPSAESLTALARRSQLPLWLPWPLPAAWVLSGACHVGDERDGVRATALALSGPNPMGGPGDLVLVAEEPGVGLGANLAGLAGPDPGAGFAADPPTAKVQAGGHPTPLWYVGGEPDRAAFVSEASGRWLWLVLWPASAARLLDEDVSLADVRALGHEVDLLPFGALSPRLAD